MSTRQRTPTKFYVPNTKSEIAISSTMAEMIESFRSIRKKLLKHFHHARQIFNDLGDLKQNTIKIGPSKKFDCSKDPDVKLAADLLMDLSSVSSIASSAPPIWSDERVLLAPRPEVDSNLNPAGRAATNRPDTHELRI